jgi:hypothetical protein
MWPKKGDYKDCDTRYNTKRSGGGGYAWLATLAVAVLMTLPSGVGWSASLQPLAPVGWLLIISCIAIAALVLFLGA